MKAADIKLGEEYAWQRGNYYSATKVIVLKAGTFEREEPMRNSFSRNPPTPRRSGSGPPGTGASLPRLPLCWTRRRERLVREIYAALDAGEVWIATDDRPSLGRAQEGRRTHVELSIGSLWGLCFGKEPPELP